MADINSKSRPESANDDGASDQPPGEPVAVTAPAATTASPEMLKIVELLFFAYRDFTGDADELLWDLGYGRAHHRVIHFVARHPGLRVADLLEILRITKQSLARVLKQLIDDGYVLQKSGTIDRRERHLYLTQKGRNLAAKLTALQCARIAGSLESIGPKGRKAIEKFLVAMISDTDQTAIAALLEDGDHTADEFSRQRSHDKHGT
jgi:DNA-binding MarR family transcriptional regulator